MRTYADKDYQMISHWCALRDMAPPPEWSLPDLGLIVDDVACGFLILTNNNCAFLDFYISNPNSEKKIRDDALDSITEELVGLSKDLKIKLLMANSRSFPIIERAKRFDFETVGEMTHFRKVL
jgi:hypothetical protein